MQQPIDSTEQYTGCGRETLYLGKYTVWINHCRFIIAHFSAAPSIFY
jgi:hypothetical protein